MIKNFYYKFLYRHIMKLAHKYGWHHMKTYDVRYTKNEIDTIIKCDWCGISDLIHKRVDKLTPEELDEWRMNNDCC